MHTTRAAAIKFLSELIVDRMTTPRALSLSLRKGPTYLSDYMGKKASPYELPERIRHNLARILNTSEDNLKFEPAVVNGSIGKTDQDVQTANMKRSASRRANDMSLGDVYIRLGKLEQRIIDLEADRPKPAAGEGKQRSRP